MRKIIMLNRISIDGFFATLNQKTWGMDWFIPDPAVDQAAHELGGESKTPLLLLMGGITYKGFERSWVPHLKDPNAPRELKAVAEELTEMPKLVFSKTIKEVTWENTRLFKGDLVAEVKKLKQEKGADIMIMGSGTIVQQLSNEGLIDEYVFILSPVIAGKGKPLFKDVKQLGLKLISAKSFDSGNILLRYAVGK